MLEFVLTHDGLNWIAKCNHITAKADTLEHLDQRIAHLIKEQQLIQSGEKKKIRYLFDNSTIPQWIRQYSNHYFNRIIEVAG